MSAKNFLSVSLFIFSMSVFAQQNITKVNVSDALLKMYSVSQERACSKHTSLQLNLKLMPNTDMAGVAFSRYFYPNASRNPFPGTKTNAMAAGMELRIYGKNKAAMEGFYWGPYLSLASYHACTGITTAEFMEQKSGAVYPVQLQQHYQVTMGSGGIQLGVQKQLGKKFRLDWTILGLGCCKADFRGKINLVNTPENLDLRNFDMDGRDAHLKFENYFPLQKTIASQSVSLRNSSWMPMLKMGIAIGLVY